MRESGGSSTGHNRETTGRANDYPFTEGRSPAPPPLTDHTKGRSPAPPPLTDHTKGRSPAPPPLTDHTKGRSPAPPPLTDHTKGRSPAPPHPPEGASKASQIEPVSLPGQGPPAAG
jgi:hypothetical protein